MLEGSRGNQGEGEGSDCWGGRGVFRARPPDGRSDSLHTGLRYAALLSLLPPLLCAAFLCSIHCARAVLWHAIEMIAHALQLSWSSVMLARSPVTHTGGPHWVTGLAHNSTFLHCVFSYMCPQNCDTHWWPPVGGHTEHITQSQNNGFHTLVRSKPLKRIPSNSELSPRPQVDLIWSENSELFNMRPFSNIRYQKCVWRFWNAWVQLCQSVHCLNVCPDLTMRSPTAKSCFVLWSEKVWKCLCK